MKPKLLLCLALVLSGGLFGCSTTVDNVKLSDLLRNCDTTPGTSYELKIYIVQQNDSLVRIAKQFGVTVAALDLYNPKMASRHAAGIHPQFKPEIGEQLLVYVDETNLPPNTGLEPRVAPPPHDFSPN